MTEKKTERAVKVLQTSREIYPMIKKHMEEAWQAKRDKTKYLCWTTAREMVWTVDNLLPLYPETFNGQCAAKQISGPLIDAAESLGYSADLCSYFRNATGYMYEHNKLDLPYPGGGMPDPDFLLCDNPGCNCLHNKWWRVMQRYYKVPMFLLDSPTTSSIRMTPETVESHYIDYIVSQFKELIAFLEEQTRSKIDEDRLKEVIRLSDRASELYDEILNLRKLKPCPLGGEDMTSFPAPMLHFSGTQRLVDFMERAVAELKERVSKGEAVIQDEKFRLIVDNIPPFYTLGLFNYLQQFKAVSVLETYNLCFNYNWQRMDPNKPLESLARKFIDYWYSLPLYEHIKRICRLVEEYQIDGLICLALKSCKVYTPVHWELANTLRQRYGIPSLIIEVDQVDFRDYNEARVKGRIEAFIEVLESKKRG